MHILIYTHVFPPRVGGIETITFELAHRLAAGARFAAHDEPQVTVITPTGGRLPNEDALPFRIVRTPTVAKLIELVRKADILHLAGTDMLPLFLGWYLDKTMVVEHHGFQTVCPNGQMIYQPTEAPCPGHYRAGRHGQCLRCNARRGWIQSLKAWFLTLPRRWLCTRAHANVMPTAWLSGVLQLPRMVTIHHGLPAAEPVTAVALRRLPRLVFLGRLVSTKGVHILLQALHQLPDCEFELNIIGDGPERARLEEEIRLLGLEGQVRFHGRLPTEAVEQLVANARAVVMPSLAGEVFGLVALESMLRQKALIVSEIGSLTEVVADTGLSFPAGNATALADCLRKVLQSDRLACEMGARAGRRARSFFTSKRMAEDHLLLYRRLLAGQPSLQPAMSSETAKPWGRVLKRS